MKLIIAQLVKEFPDFTETEGSFPCPFEPETVKPRLKFHIPFRYATF